jgi:hypothetical protein
MVAAKQQATQMGKMGKRHVQESKYQLLENEVQRTTYIILTLAIGMSLKYSDI